MLQGQMLPGQMLAWQLGPRNLPLKFGPNRVSNCWDNTDIEFVWVGGGGCGVGSNGSGDGSCDVNDHDGETDSNVGAIGIQWWLKFWCCVML